MIFYSENRNAFIKTIDSSTVPSYFLFWMWKWKLNTLHFFEGIEFKISQSILYLKDDYIIKLVDYMNKISKTINTYFTVVNEIFMPKYLKDL